jgi:hypothetical protein
VETLIELANAAHRDLDDGVGQIDDRLGDAIGFTAEDEAHWKSRDECLRTNAVRRQFNNDNLVSASLRADNRFLG